jgi:hypothetical protein
VVGVRHVTRAHRAQRFQVCRDRSARGKITPGRRNVRTAGARKERSEQQHRAAQPADQRSVRRMLEDGGRTHPEGRAADSLDLGAEIEQQPRHHLDVADPRDVRQDAFVFGQQARGQQRQGRVLVALDGDLPLQPVPAFDQ